LSIQSDDTEFALFTLPDAELTISYRHESGKVPEVCLFGNRQGIISLANLLLWLLANSSRKEFLAVTGLPFVSVEGAASLTIRLTDTEESGNYGLVHALDKGSQFEWELSEDDLRNLSLSVHHLGSMPEHEYDIFPLGNKTDVRVHIRLTDLKKYL
jgi:hypothetical protein